MHDQYEIAMPHDASFLALGGIMEVLTGWAGLLEGSDWLAGWLGRMRLSSCSAE